MVVSFCGIQSYLSNHNDSYNAILEVKRTTKQDYNKSFDKILQAEMEKVNDIQNNSARSARFT